MFKEYKRFRYFCEVFLHKKTREKKHLFMMNKTKLKVYKKVVHEVCEKFDGAEEFIKEKTEEICFQEKLSVEEATYFVYEILRFVVSF